MNTDGFREHVPGNATAGQEATYLELRGRSPSEIQGAVLDLEYTENGMLTQKSVQAVIGQKDDDNMYPFRFALDGWSRPATPMVLHLSNAKYTYPPNNPPQTIPHLAPTITMFFISSTDWGCDPAAPPS